MYTSLSPGTFTGQEQLVPLGRWSQGRLGSGWQWSSLTLPWSKPRRTPGQNRYNSCREFFQMYCNQNKAKVLWNYTTNTEMSVLLKNILHVMKFMRLFKDVLFTVNSEVTTFTKTSLWGGFQFYLKQQPNVPCGRCAGMARGCSPHHICAYCQRLPCDLLAQHFKMNTDIIDLRTGKKKI